MLRLGAARAELRVVDDQVGAPTSAAAIAAATVRLVELPAPPGIYHMTAAGSTSWCGLRAPFSVQLGLASPRMQPIPSSEYPTPAKRPANSVLSNEKFNHTFGFRLPTGSSNCTVLAGMRKMRQ